jgi:hypothetical protein
MTSRTGHTAVDSLADDRTSDDDIFGVARYLADAVEHGDISEEDGECALLEWAGPDPRVLERAATRVDPSSDTRRISPRRVASSW